MIIEGAFIAYNSCKFICLFICWKINIIQLKHGI